jgi:hypothetical protein
MIKSAVSFVETVDRILSRIKEQSTIVSSAPVASRSNGCAVASFSDGGGWSTMTTSELSELSLLCTQMDQQSTQRTTMLEEARTGMGIARKSQSQKPKGFGTVDTEDLITLLDILKNHIILSLRINLFEAAMDAIQMESCPSAMLMAFQKVLENR